MEKISAAHRARLLGFWGGPLLCLLLLLLPVPAGMNPLTWKALALLSLMVVWWFTEAMPLPVTALLPLVVFPIMGIMPPRETAMPYAHPIIFLFLGGFIIAIAIEKSNLHLRIALNIVRLIGTRPDRMVGGFMVSTAFLSMWISNTATVLMMLPMALSVIKLMWDILEKKSRKTAQNFGLCMLLGIAYASGIGGVGTLIGTPPNAFAKAFFNNTYGYEISFFSWMKLGVPFVVVMTYGMWVVMTRFIFPIRTLEITQAEQIIEDEYRRLGRMSHEEKLAGSVGLFTALCWIFESHISDAIPGVNEVTIALVGALLLFTIPLNFRDNQYLITWRDAEQLPWGVLILFGGGLSLAAGLEATGLAGWIGLQFEGSGEALPHWLLIVIVVTVMVITTTFMSNVAAATLLVPIVSSIAIGMGENPLIFAIPATMAASCAFMLPVAAASNAIVFGTGYMTIPQMVRAGFALSVFSIIVLLAMTQFLMPAVMDVQLGVLPEWATGKTAP